MSILHYNLDSSARDGTCLRNDDDARYQRDARGDLKHGLDLIFELKAEIDKMHPIARETLIILLTH